MTGEGAAKAAPADAPQGDLRVEVRAALEGGLTQARAAKQIGISAAALSQWLADTYDGDSAAVEGKVRRWLDSRERRSELEKRVPDDPGWVETPTAKRIQAALSFGQLRGRSVMVHGAAGAGKTFACRHYADTAPNVWLATMSAGAIKPFACLRRVAAACGVATRAGNPADLEDAVAARLRGTRGLLIVDEAQHLTLPAIESLRHVADSSGCGLALVGNDRLRETMGNLEQLVSRVRLQLHLPGVVAGDVDAIAAAWGVKEAGARREARRIAGTTGGLRGLSDALPDAFARSGGETVSAEDLKAVSGGLA